jgi:hypothetical protein
VRKKGCQQGRAAACEKRVVNKFPKKPPIFFRLRRAVTKMYMAICPQKVPKFFRLRRAVTKMYMAICPLKKNPNFFRLRRVVTKICIRSFAPPPKTSNFFSPAAGCHKNVYMVIPPPKTSNFFSPAAGCHKDVYGHLPPKKYGQIAPIHLFLIDFAVLTILSCKKKHHM